jgi:DNA mismatch repair protein MutS2
VREEQQREGSRGGGGGGGGGGGRGGGMHSVVVLLDEPGGGTDPAEGAALATALLRASAARARLTVATSHYEEVKALAIGDEATGVAAMVGAANAAVEFDAVTLRPTYRLMWWGRVAGGGRGV